MLNAKEKSKYWRTPWLTCHLIVTHLEISYTLLYTVGKFFQFFFYVSTGMPIRNGAFSCICFINRGTFAVIVMLISSLSIHPIGNQEPGERECSFEAIFGQTSNAVVARDVSYWVHKNLKLIRRWDTVRLPKSRMLFFSKLIQFFFTSEAQFLIIGCPLPIAWEWLLVAPKSQPSWIRNWIRN